MFDDDKKIPPKQGYHSEGRRYASRIHYTVTPIENLKEWKKEQARKEDEYQAVKLLKYQDTRARVVKMLEDSIEAEKLRRKALREQNAANAGLMLDRQVAEAPARAEAAKAFNEEGKFMWTPKAPTYCNSARVSCTCMACSEYPMPAKKSLWTRVKEFFK